MKKTAHMGLFLASALILSYIESLIPFYFGIPGVKLGLANLAVLFALWMEGSPAFKPYAYPAGRLPFRKPVYHHLQPGRRHYQLLRNVPAKAARQLQHPRGQHSRGRIPQYRADTGSILRNKNRGSSLLSPRPLNSRDHHRPTHRAGCQGSTEILECQA